MASSQKTISSHPSTRRAADKGGASDVRRILNCRPSARVERDWQFSHAVGAQVAKVTPVPTSIDLRESWWEIGDQEATGSCVGWAAADSVLRWHMTKAGKIKKSHRLSTRFIWMAAKEIDEYDDEPTSFIESDGTSLKAALDVARRYGAVLEEMLPFAQSVLYTGETRTFYAVAARLKITSYYNLGRNPEVWRRWIAQNGPVLTRLDVDDTWMRARETKGVLKTYKPRSAQGGHAVALVGYDKTGFIVRNSWGTASWGDKGFGYASNDYAEAAFTESYGVTVA